MLRAQLLDRRGCVLALEQRRELLARAHRPRERARAGTGPGPRLRGRRRGLFDPRELDRDLAVPEKHAGEISRRRRPVDHEPGERADHGALDLALQRPGAVARVEALPAEHVDHGIVDLDEQLSAGDALEQQQPPELAARDLPDVSSPSGRNGDDPVDAVEELRPEESLGLLDVVAGRVVPRSRRRSRAARSGSASAPRFEVMITIALRKSAVTAGGVGQAPLAERAQSRVEDVRVRLLDLVEQDDAEGLLADAARELALVLVPPGRADQLATASPAAYSPMSKPDQRAPARRTGTRRAPSRARSCRRRSGRRRRSDAERLVAGSRARP